jgi:hypothetical protein
MCTDMTRGTLEVMPMTIGYHTLGPLARVHPAARPVWHERGHLRKEKLFPRGGTGERQRGQPPTPSPRFKKKQKPFLLADGRVNGRDRVMSLLLGPDLQP